jgi:hypothetical protein
VIRFASLIAGIEAQYQGPEDWLVGAEYAHSNEEAVNRIVAYPVNGQIAGPDIAAQGWPLYELAPNVTAPDVDPIPRDDLLAVRMVNVAFEVWAADGATAENRLHALIVAINSIENVGAMSEDWPQSRGNVTGGGCMVILTAALRVYVIASDATTVREVDPTEAGAGVDQAAVNQLTVDAYQDEELIASYES